MTPKIGQLLPVITVGFQACAARTIIDVDTKFLAQR
jgi:hypothetical protein